MNNEVLQRRLVGALVLFAVAFVLASLLPDARTPDRSGGAQVVTYDLSTGLQLDDGISGTSSTADTADAPSKVPSPPPRTAVQLQQSPELSSSESWYVQVGSFENQTNARSVLVKLYQMGLPTAIQSVQVGKTLWYRVRVGPYQKESLAKDALGAIHRKGYAGAKLVRPGSQ